VIFDLDGLLADTEPLWSESTDLLLKRRGHRFDPALKPDFMGRHPLEVAGRLIKHYDLTGDSADRLLEERLAILEQLYAERRIAPMPGAVVLVEALALQGTPMAVASGSPTRLLGSVLSQIALTSHLPVQVGSDQVQCGKPAPDLFLLAARRLGVAPESCVVLEDAITGVDAARAAGMAVVAVPGPAIPRERVVHADLVVASLEQLTPAVLARVANAGTA